MYNVNDPDIIDQLVLLTGSRTTAIGLYNIAAHMAKTSGVNTFSVHFHDLEWQCIFNLAGAMTTDTVK